MKKLIYILLFIIISCDMEKDVLITINTPYGDMKAILFEETPLHKKNFITLTKEEKFNSTIFHRVIKDFISEYEKLSTLSREVLEPIIKSLIDKHKTNFKGVGQPLRIALVGSRFGPGLYDVILSLDKAEVVKRLKQI